MSFCESSGQGEQLLGFKSDSFSNLRSKTAALVAIPALQLGWNGAPISPHPDEPMSFPLCPGTAAAALLLLSAPSPHSSALQMAPSALPLCLAHAE